MSSRIAVLCAAAFCASGCVSFDPAAARREQSEAFSADLARKEAEWLAEPLTLARCLEIAQTNNYAVRKADLDAALGRFSQDAAFSAFFKRHTGQTPTQYAQSHDAQAPSAVYVSPLGPMLIAENDGGIARIIFLQDTDPAPTSRAPGRYLRDAAAQLCEYFARTRTSFDLPLAPRAIPFQRRVWAALREIPYGETVSYGQLAARIGNPRAARAVGMANNRNPLMIVQPCHRVVGKDGALVGYAGGIERKRRLLELERGRSDLAPSP